MTTAYSATIDYLFTLQKFGIKLGLDTIRLLLDRIGRPHQRYPTIHIAGTNGKGSTAAMAASVFQAAGYRVGLYTSPHLIDFRERIQVNGVSISEERVVALTRRLQQAALPSLSPTFFEFTTAMAFSYFAEAGVDLGVIEVGLGGRFDATNVVTPFATCITTIGLDHQRHLGDSLESIAYEKGGILKPEIPLVVGRVGPEALGVLQGLCKEQVVPSYVLGRDFSCTTSEQGDVEYSGLTHVYQKISCPLVGTHQLDNAACALALVEIAGPRGFEVTEAQVQAGFGCLAWEGRLEIAETRPLLVLDGAHNPSASHVVADFLHSFRREHPEAKVIIVIGMMRDKDYQGIMAPLLTHADCIIVTQPLLPRAATVQELNPNGRTSTEGWYEVTNPSDALALARRLTSPDDLICVTGSLMLVGDIKSHLRGCNVSPLRD